MAIMAGDAGYFDRMLNLIPSRFYLPPDPELVHSQWKQKYLKNTKGNAPKQELKEKSQKGKRAKFDIQQNKSTAEEQQEHAKKNALQPTPVFKPTRPGSSRGGLDSLRDRLQVRIAKLKSERHANATNSATTRRNKRAAARINSEITNSETVGTDLLASRIDEQSAKKKASKATGLRGHF